MATVPKRNKLAPVSMICFRRKKKVADVTLEWRATDWPEITISDEPEMRAVAIMFGHVSTLIEAT
jgi:hypothetical protein